jgi:succinyl-CoA synthetase beta subunit
MLNTRIKTIIETGRSRGWLLEPDAKSLFAEQGFDVPESVLAAELDTALAFLNSSSGPVVAKAVSSEILHKTEYGAVITSITTPEKLVSAFSFLKGLPGVDSVLVEAMVPGIEIILGAKNDYQFGPVVLLGTGGTGVEIFSDIAIRMAPLKPLDVISMVNDLKGAAIIKGFRGHHGVDMDRLTDLVVRFSTLVMDLEEEIASIDLNPVICTKSQCVVADARILLS